MKSINKERVKQEIAGRIQHLQPDLNRRWGKMNVRQMICHLNDSFLCVIGERPASIAPNFRSRKLVKWCALYLPTPWPQGVPTRPEIDQELGGTVPSDFEQDRQVLLALVKRFSRQPRDFSFHPHPIFLEMTEKQWMRWGYLHTDHHLRQFGA